VIDKHLHIVTHDIPFPVRHGGLVDLYHSLVALYECGVKIHLHCFKKKNQAEQAELNKYCVSVNYYARTTGVLGLNYSLPYIVSSRKSKKLTVVLNEDDYPILLGGVHCSGLLYEKSLQTRKFILRLYNVEHKYYRQLGRYERNTFKKIYYYSESRLLETYERDMAARVTVAALSENDARFYKNELYADAVYVPAFIPYKNVHYKNENGMYCLYHANLSVNENEEVVRWLLENVFTNLPIPFVVAGRNPSPQLASLIESKEHACLVANPSESEMQDMIVKSQVNILPSFNNTGVKLKLINALFNGKHCLVNKAGVQGSGLEKLCSIAESPTAFKQEIKRLFDQSITPEQIAQRKEILNSLYNNEKNARLLMSLIW